MQWAKENRFLLSVLAAIGLAVLFPEAGSKDGWMHSDILIRIGVFAIFLMQGLRIHSEELARGMADWRLHLFVQTWNFVWIPLIVLALGLVAGGLVPAELTAGFLFLAILPTTISSSVALTISSDGDVPGALFNTSLSNILGVFIVPLWSVWMIASATGGEAVSVGPLLGKLALLMILPVVIGQVLRPFLSGLIERTKKAFRPTSNAIILFMIYAAFANSITEQVWTRVGFDVVAWSLAGAIVLLAIVSTLIVLTSRRLLATPEKQRAAFFCASHKTLAAGIPMAAAIFGTNGMGAIDLSIILLPLMCYHPLQLMLGALMTRRL